MSKVIRVIIVLATFTSVANCDSEEDTLGDKFLPIILAKAKAIPIDNYESDPALAQKVDRLNDITRYEDPFSDEVLYERSSNDLDKDVVVIPPNEETMGTLFSKHTYIVLRLSPFKLKIPRYYVSLAYVLKARKGDDSAFEVDGKKYVIEWAVWDDHVLNGVKYSVGFTMCVYSVIAPCGFNETSLNPVQKTALEYQDVKEMGTSSKDGAKKKEKPKFKAPAGYDLNEYYEFYKDLEPSNKHGRSWVVGKIFDVVGGAVDGVAHLWCGISGAILGQCDEYDPELGFIKSTIPGGVVTDDGRVIAEGAHGANAGLLGAIAGGITTIGGEDPRLMTRGGASVAGAINNAAGGVFGNTGVLGKRKRETETKQELPKFGGWHTQYLATSSPNVTLRHESKIFYGVGNCWYDEESASLAALQRAQNANDIVKHYVAVLKNDCLTRFSNVMLALILDKNLQLNGDKVFTFTPDSKLASEPKLNWKDEQKLTNAFEITTFTAQYIKHSATKHKGKYVNKNGDQITRSIKFLEDFTIAFLEQVKSIARRHWIRLCRHIMQVLRKVLTKSEEDFINLDYCEGNCSPDRKINKNDRFVLVGLVKFIIHGLGPVADKNEDVAKTYDAFYKLNKDAILAAVDFDD